MPGCMLQTAGWFVAFSGRERKHWYDVFTTPGFRHVSAFTPIEGGDRLTEQAWLFVDPSTYGMRVEVMTNDEMDLVIAGIHQNAGRVVCLDRRPAPEPSAIPRYGWYCVSEIERLLGLPQRALRPVGLYRRLLALGATPVFEELREDGVF